MALDPKDILDATHSVNEEVLDSALRHAHFTQRLTSHEVNEIVGFLNDDVFPDVLTNLRQRLENISQRGFDTGPWTTSRVRNLLGSTNEIMQKGMQVAGNNLRSDLKAIARTEAQWQARSLAKSTGALNFAFNTPTVGQLNSILTSRPYQGKVFTKWWKQLSGSAQDTINRQVGIGLAEGETVDQMVRRVRGTVGARFTDGALEKVRHNTEATVRTAANHVNTQARELTYEENDDVIKGIQYVATLDGRTTDICMSLDGTIHELGEGPRPPQHYQCRSTTVPVLKSLEELGLPAMKKALPPGTRATKELRGNLQKSMNGQVPAKQTYGAWLKKQTTAQQNEILGPSRAKLFRSGRVAIDKFVDTRGRTLTLDQLRKKEGLPAEKPVAPSPPPIPTYTEQATVEEARDQLGEMLDTKVSVADEVKGSEGGEYLRPSTSGRLDKGMKDRLNVASQDVSRMRKKYSEFDQMVRERKPLHSVTVVTGKSITLRGSEVTGYYSNSHRGIVIGQTKEAGSGAVALGKGRWTTSAGNFNTAFRHELGHDFYYNVRSSSMSSIELIQTWNRMYYRKSMNWWKEISGYAATSSTEGFAECFAVYTHPQYGIGGKANRLPVVVEKFFDKALGKKG